MQKAAILYELGRIAELRTQRSLRPCPKKSPLKKANDMKSIKLRIGKISYTALNKIPILLLAVVSCLTVSTVLIEEAVAADSSKALPTAPAPVVASWIKCSSQNGTCNYPAGTQTLRYGDGTSWIKKSVATGAAGFIGCNNTVWTDPKPGIVKACMYTMTKL